MLLKILLLLLLLLVSGLVLNIVWIHSVSKNIVNADTLLVCGCKDPNILNERMVAAYELCQNHSFKKIILSGGNQESENMKSFLLNRGVKSEMIIEDNLSKDTIQNIQFSKQLMVQNNLESCVIVSSSFHLRRLQVIAKHYNLNSRFYAYRDWKTPFKEFVWSMKENRHIHITKLILSGKLRSIYDEPVVNSK